MNIALEALLFCNGLVEQPREPIDRHLQLFEQFLRENGVPDECGVQLNLDWRNDHTSAIELLQSGLERFGDRLKSVVTYFDPAHSFQELRQLFSLPRSSAHALFCRMVLRSAQSVQAYHRLIQAATNEPRGQCVPVAAVDTLPPSVIAAFAALCRQRAHIPRLQLSHNTPRWLRELVPADWWHNAQIAIGRTAGISERGDIRLEEGMVVAGSYNLYTHIHDAELLCRNLPWVVMGPTLPGWTMAENDARLRAILKLLSAVTESRLPIERYPAAAARWTPQSGCLAAEAI